MTNPSTQKREQKRKNKQLTINGWETSLAPEKPENRKTLTDLNLFRALSSVIFDTLDYTAQEKAHNERRISMCKAFTSW
jgi:hypothetical protein